MTEKRWTVRVYDGIHLCGSVYFPTRKLARHFASTFGLPSWLDKGFHARVGRTSKVFWDSWSEAR